MSARAFLTNILVIVSVMAVAALLETAVPLVTAKACTRGRRTANLGLTVIVFLLNWALTLVAAAQQAVEAAQALVHSAKSS